MKQRLQISKEGDSSATHSKETQFHLHPSTQKTQQDTNKTLSQTDIENEEFQQHQIEAINLQLQAKQGIITPEAQTQLTLLQAKMNDVLYRRVKQGSNFGNNLGKIVFHHPDRMPFSNLPHVVQPKLTIGQPGDQYEQEADTVATIQNQTNKDEAKTGTTDTDNGVADKKQQFLSNYTVAKELVEGIEENLAQDQPDKILDQLLQNFQKISFKYTMSYKQGTTLLKGTREGDCKTLAEAFQTVAQEYFGIADIKIEQIKKPFLSEANDTVYQGRKRNCDQGKRWFFENHYWVTWNGKIYDILFLSNKRPEVDMARQENPIKSMLMPEGEYYETEKGKVVYCRGNEYLTIELSMFEKLKNLTNNFSNLMSKNLDSIINRIRDLLTRGGNNNSDFESLVREVENHRTSLVTHNNQNN
jgi:hypothetical protein